MKNTLVVAGATGQQGLSVINAVLADPQLSQEYAIRGLTRDPSQPGSQELSKKGVEMVAADFNDAASLRQAFTGAHVVFANHVTVYDGRTLEHEIEDGRALADAAVAVGVPSYIYSTLSHAGNISGGKLTHMGHFDGKAEVEAYIRTLPIRSAFIAPGTFMSNFTHGMAPRPAGEGVYAVAMPVRADTQLPLLDTLSDTGKWVAAILADFSAYEGKVLSCATRLYTFQEIVDIMAKVTGKTVVYKQVPEEAWKAHMRPNMAEHIAQMLRFFQDYGYYGEDTAKKLEWSASQARGKLTTLEEFLETHPLRLDQGRGQGRH